MKIKREHEMQYGEKKFNCQIRKHFKQIRDKHEIFLKWFLKKGRRGYLLIDYLHTFKTNF